MATELEVVDLHRENTVSFEFRGNTVNTSYEIFSNIFVF